MGLAPDVGERTVIWLRGEHDAFTMAALSDSMNRVIALDDGDVVVDLSGVEFMGVATINVLRETRDRLGILSRSLTLRSPSSRAQRVLGLCGLACSAGQLMPGK